MINKTVGLSLLFSACALLTSCGSGSNPTAPAIEGPSSSTPTPAPVPAPPAALGSVSSFTPAKLLAGATLTINGTDLDQASAVEFTGNLSAPIATRSGTNQITVVVPEQANSGPITVVFNSGSRVSSVTPLTVTPLILVINPTVLRAAPGDEVTLNGSGLTEVLKVTVGGVEASITARSSSQLTFKVPTGIVCGAVSLLSASQAAVAAGGVVSGASCPSRIEAVEVAQVLSQAADAPYQRLVPGKETWVRAYVLAEEAGVAAPTVRVVGYRGSTRLGSVDLVGPATLPVLAAGTVLPASLKYDRSRSFNVEIPATWIEAGIRLQVVIDPEQTVGPAKTFELTPAIGQDTAIDLVLVPLVSGGNQPSVDSSAISEALDELTRHMPVPRSRIKVSLRQAFTLTSVTDGVNTTSEWIAALQELERLRLLEGKGRHYYGLVRPLVSAGVAGIGYVNGTGAANPALSALGWDTSRSSWRRTMTHELGHNFSRPHAPCGSAGDADASYPYANGLLSDAPLFDSLSNTIVSPLGQTDVMGYCQGAWFSDYNLLEVQRFLEALPKVSMLNTAAVKSASVSGASALVVSGRITAQGVQLDSLQQVRRAAEATPVTGDYLLRLQTIDGRSIEYAFSAQSVDHANPPESHFLFDIPNPGTLRAVEVVRGQKVLVARRALITEQAQTKLGVSNATEATSKQYGLLWKEENGQLIVSWDVSRAPEMTLSYLLAGERSVLTIAAKGGQARLDMKALPRGGEFEFSFSDGLNTSVVTVLR